MVKESVSWTIDTEVLEVVKDRAKEEERSESNMANKILREGCGI